MKKVLYIYLIFHIIKSEKDVKIRYKLENHDCTLSNIIISDLLIDNKLEKYQFAKYTTDYSVKYCPFLRLNCCSDDVIKNLVISFNKNIKELESYFFDLKNNIENVQNLNPEIFSDLKTFNDDFRTGKSECLSDNTDTLKYRLEKLKSDFPSKIEFIIEIIGNLKIYYSGIICSLCDGMEIRNIKKNPKTKKTSDSEITPKNKEEVLEKEYQHLDFNLNINNCIRLNSSYIKMLKIAEYLLDSYKLIRDMLCLAHENIRMEFSLGDFDEFFDLLTRRKKIGRACMIGKDYFSMNCDLYCRNIIMIFHWYDEFDLLKISEFNSIFLNFFGAKKRNKESKDFISFKEKKFIQTSITDWEEKFYVIKKKEDKDEEEKSSDEKKK